MLIVNVLLLMAVSAWLGYSYAKGNIEIVRKASKEEVKLMWEEIEEKKREYEVAIEDLNKLNEGLYGGTDEEL